MPVLPGIVHIGLRAVVKNQAARALNFQKKDVHRVRGPGQFQAPVGQHLLFLNGAAVMVAAAFGAHPPEIRRQAVDGLGIARLARTAGPYLRLVVAGIIDAARHFHPAEVRQQQAGLRIQTRQQIPQAGQAAGEIPPGHGQARPFDGRRALRLAVDIAQRLAHGRGHVLPAGQILVAGGQIGDEKFRAFLHGHRRPQRRQFFGLRLLAGAGGERETRQQNHNQGRAQRAPGPC